MKKLTLYTLLFIFCFGIAGSASAQIYRDKAPKLQTPPDAKAQEKMARKQAKKAAKAQKKLAKQTRKAQKKAAKQYKNKHPEAS